MRKLILSALAATALLAAAASSANAGYWVPGVYGPVYVPTCVYGPYGSYCG